MNPGRKDHVYVGKKGGVKVYEQKRYLLWKIRDLHEIANGGSVNEEVGGDSFSNAFGRPLKFALLYDVLKLRKECVFNREIPQLSCLCELCENVTLLATGVNKVLKDKLPMWRSLLAVVPDIACTMLPAKSVLLLISIFQTIWK